MRTSSRRLIALVAAAISVGLLLTFYTGSQHHIGSLVVLEQNHSLCAPHRKLLGHAAMEAKQSKKKAMEPNRMWGERCSKSDIVVNQGPTDPLPNGIPTYTVEIMNVCASGCDVSRIHLSCGWFSSARMINPKVFKRIRYDDCIVNDGKSLINGGTLSFQYANTYRYPLSVSSVNC